MIRYQPIVRVADRAVVALEALARWSGPDGRPAEQVLDQVCRDLGRLRRHQPELAVHVSLAALRPTGPDLAGAVALALDEHGIEPDALVVEVTGTDHGDPEPAVVVLARLRDLGVRLALDDVGAGGTSLQAVGHLPVDIMKLDRSLLVDGEHDPTVTAVRDALLLLAHRLDRQVIADGVESSPEADAVFAAGVEFAQGSLFGPPARAADALLVGPRRAGAH